MKVVYHPGVQKDVSAILRYYDTISPRLGDEFWAELMEFIETAATHPKRGRSLDDELRRVNLKRFPYHFLFRILPDKIRVTVVRHHKQHPARGLKRR